MTFDRTEYRRKDLIGSFIIATFHRTCVCSETYNPCLRCQLLDKAEELFPEEYHKCAAAVARNKGNK